MTLELLYEQMLLEGQLQPRPEEQEAYDRLVAINNKAGTRDFTDALLQWYRSSLKQNNEDISFDKTNHIRDTLSILNKMLANGTLKPGTEVSIDTPRGIQKKDISNPRSFFRFDAFEGALRNYLNQQTASEGEQYIQQTDLSKARISLYKAVPDLVVWATQGYEDTLAFIRILWPKMQGTSNLGAYGADAYQNDLCPYCTSGKGHWKEYSSGKNYTQYWFLKNIGTELKDYYGKGKETLYAMLDSDGDLLDKYDVEFGMFFDNPYPSFIPLVEELFSKHKKTMDDRDENGSLFNVLEVPTPERIEEMRKEFYADLKHWTDGDGVYGGDLEVPPYITSLKGFPKEIDGDFNIAHNPHITTLRGSPKIVQNGCTFYNLPNLTSLVGGPKEVYSHYFVNYTQITNLKGMATTIGQINVAHNKLVSLEGAMLEDPVTEFDCSYNELTTLKGCPKIVGDFFDCSHNQLTSLKHGPVEVGGSYFAHNNKLTSLDGIAGEIGHMDAKDFPINFTKDDIVLAMRRSRGEEPISHKKPTKKPTKKKIKIKEDHIFQFDKLINLYERHLQGGLADGMTPEDLAKKHGVSIEKIYQQIDKGTEVEFEHTDDIRIAREIAEDHVYEIWDYYDRLEKMERSANVQEMTAGSVTGATSTQGGSIGNSDFYATGDTRIPHSIYGGVVTRNGKLGKKKRKKRKKKDA